MVYDPKRPRPSAAADDEPAPVEALLGEGDDVSDGPSTDASPTSTEPTSTEPVIDEPAAAEVVDLTGTSPGPDQVLGAPVAGASSNGSGLRPSPEVPVAPAPEEGTTNRAVLAAALGGSLLVVILLLLWRRRRSDTA